MLTVMVVSLICLSAVAARAAEPVRIANLKDQRILDSFLQHVARVPEHINPEYCKQMAELDAEQREAYTWDIMPYLRMPLTAYELTRSPKYLGIFVRTFENMRSALTEGPDGFLGWYGRATPDYRDPNDPDRRVDAIISSFSTTETVCEFLALAAEDPALNSRYARQRAEYLDLIENHLVKKHDVRGDYVDLGSAGAIYRMPPSGLKPTTARLTLPHNKHEIIMRGLLALYRVTGKDEYMRKAIKLGSRFKHCLTLKEGRYQWHYWDPAGAWDINPQDSSRWKHWIGPEHRGGYYSLSLTTAVTLHQYGLVFDGTDIERFLKTQLEVCWNGDMTNPQWSRVDGSRPPEYTQGAYISHALAPFSEKVAEFLFTGARQEERLEMASHDWQGGPVTNGWLRAKYIDYPAARRGKSRGQAPNLPYLEWGKRFLAKPENREFIKSLAFEVTPPGYVPPMSPAEMTPMPGEPKCP